jgi:hypothetical protein
MIIMKKKPEELLPLARNALEIAGDLTQKIGQLAG